MWPEPRTVRPRARREVEVKDIFVALTAENRAMYRGELLDLQDAIERFHEHPQGTNQHSVGWLAERIDPCLVVTDDGVRLTAMFTERFGADPFWQYRVDARLERPVMGGDMPAPADDGSDGWTDGNREYYQVAFFGWASRAGELRRAGGRSRYWRVLDARTFHRARGHHVLDDYGGCTLGGLFRFAEDLQTWHVEQGAPLRFTVGSIGTALSYDPRFFEQPRRKVPAKTNAAGRRALGNFYRLAVPEDTFVGHVLHPDISAAHHQAALRVCAPDPNELYVWGNYHRLPADGDPYDGRAVFADAGDERFGQAIEREHGLFLCVVHATLHAATDKLTHPAARTPEPTFRYLYSGELEFVRGLPGVTVSAIVAGWTSQTLSDALERQGAYSLAQRAESSPQRLGWLKPALLAGYGALATRPRPFTVAYHRSHAGKFADYMGPQGDTLLVYEHRLRRRDEPGHVNTIWLGLIHAWVRCEALAYARQLRAAGWRVLSVYVDGLYVEARPGHELPERPLWRLKEEHRNMWLISEQQWIAATGQRLPGCGGRERLRLLAEHDGMVREHANHTRSQAA